MVENKNEHQKALPFDISRGAKRQCEQELKCSQCNKIYITNSFLKECRHHFCEECIYFWLSNSFSDYLFETYSSCAEKLSDAIRGKASNGISPYGSDAIRGKASNGIANGVLLRWRQKTPVKTH